MRTSITDDTIKEQIEEIEIIIKGWQESSDTIKALIEALENEKGKSKPGKVPYHELEYRISQLKDELMAKNLLIQRRRQMAEQMAEQYSKQVEILESEEAGAYRELDNLKVSDNAIRNSIDGLQKRYEAKAWQGHAHRWGDFRLGTNIIQAVRREEEENAKRKGSNIIKPRITQASSKYIR